MIGRDARAYEGNFPFSLGPNNKAGGARITAWHLDIPRRSCTVSLDGEDVMSNECYKNAHYQQLICRLLDKFLDCRD